MLNESTGYIRLTRFSKNAPTEIQQALRSLEKEDVSEIILDLRDNPGGLLAAAIDIMDIFIPKGELLLTTRGRTKASNKTYHARRPISVSRNIKIAILINEGSASASEIVAGAFQDLDRGIIIGQSSFGKGLVQSVFSLDPTRSLKITTAKYYIPSGRLIQKSDYVDEDIVIQIAEEDSIFSTKGGRAVKGGGGIHPDHEVDSEELPPLTQECLRKGIFFSYAQKHKHLYRSFDQVVNDESLLIKFHTFIEEQEVDVALPGENQFRDAWKKLEDYTEGNSKLHFAFTKAEEVIIESENALFNNELNELERGLFLEFAGLFGGTESRIRESLKNDVVVQKAMSILSNQVAYNGTFSIPN
jgi:carboxyl-terminal processing protease